jgi:hypothetical protein
LKEGGDTLHNNDPTLPPLVVLDALRRARPKPYRLTGSDTGRVAPSPLQKALAAAEVLPKGQHLPPPSVLSALYWRVVRRCSPTNTKYNFSPLGRHLAAQRAGEDRARRVLVRRGRRVLGLLPEELGPDDEVLADDDPYFRKKKGRPHAVVEAWREKPPTWMID